MYAITATVTKRQGEWTSTRQVPTFYLDERVQGIVSEEHAEGIACSVLTGVGLLDAEIHVSAVKL